MLSSLGVQQHTSALEMISTPRLPPVPGHDLVAFRSPKESFAPSVPPARQAGSVVDLEALWEKGTGWILGRWRYSEADQEELRKQRAKDARIRSELRRLNEEASYEPVSCVPLSNSALAFLDYLEAAAAPDAAAAARDVPPTPKPLPPSAPPAPTQAQAASEAALSVDGVRRTP